MTTQILSAVITAGRIFETIKSGASSLRLLGGTALTTAGFDRARFLGFVSGVSPVYRAAMGKDDVVVMLDGVLGRFEVAVGDMPTMSPEISRTSHKPIDPSTLAGAVKATEAAV